MLKAWQSGEAACAYMAAGAQSGPDPERADAPASAHSHRAHEQTQNSGLTDEHPQSHPTEISGRDHSALSSPFAVPAPPRQPPAMGILVALLQVPGPCFCDAADSTFCHLLRA